MKKITLLTTSILALGTLGLTAGSQLSHADATTSSTQLQDIKTNQSSRSVILDQGKFISPVHVDPYNYVLNNELGFSTGVMVIDYDSTTLTTLVGETVRHFNLKLPTEFNQISSLNGGANLRAAISASYKLPGEGEHTMFEPEEIDTSKTGQIDFKLPAVKLDSIGQVTSLRIQINYGKILDDLDKGGSFDYKQVIPDSQMAGYTFKGIMSSSKWLDAWPADAATGITDSTEAIQS